MKRGYKIRIYPDQQQADALSVQFGLARWVWNHCLAEKSQAWKEEQRSLSQSAQIKALPVLKAQEETSWLGEGDSQVLQQSVIRLHEAFDKFFNKGHGYPRFKKKHGYQSITYPQRVRVNRSDGVIFLPKIGWVNAVFHRPFEDGDVIKQVIVSRSETGKYHASISIDNPKVQAPELAEELNEDEIVGLDLGIADFASTSEGAKIPNQRFVKRAEKNLRRKQKSLSRKKKGSANRAKARRAVAKAHERLANTRRDFQQKLSRQIVDENQAVVVETLKVKNMMKNKRLSKHIADVSWSQFVSFLEYKLNWTGKRLVKIDQWFPSSKTCSSCSTIMNDMPLDVRQWNCPNCGVSHDRDINAAKNIKIEGVRLLQAEGLFVSAC